MTNRDGRLSSTRWLWGIAIAGTAVAAVIAASHGQNTRTGPQSFSAAALFSDTTPQFLSPAQPKLGQPFKVELRAGRNQLRSAVLNFAGQNLSMTKFKSDTWFDYYHATVPGQTDMQLYYFQVTPYEGKRVYFGVSGVNPNPPSNAGEYSVYPGFISPDWAKGAVFYQIFPDRFYNGDKANDVVSGEYNDMGPSVHVSDWSKLPGRDDMGNDDRTREFYGGDLQGVMDKLRYLNNVGNHAETVTIPAWQLTTPDVTVWRVRAMVGQMQYDSYTQSGGNVTVTVPEGGAVLLTAPVH